MMPEQITIAGHPFTVPLRYEEGQEITTAEANLLNKALHEKLRNCFAPRVKAAVQSGIFNLSALQDQFDRYTEGYQLGGRQPRGTRKSAGDPVAKEALRLARTAVEKQLRQKGIDPRSVETEAITSKAKWAVLNKPHFMEEARIRVHAAQAIAQDDLTDFIYDYNPRAAE
ncbi:MAG TPA: hypothetical protein VN203_16655 [Candidatus Acidoferrum sp.]|nr:hypothetical protein [Candidatus Acidoferrum sp.]